MRILASFLSFVLLMAVLVVPPVKAASSPTWNLAGEHLLELVCTSGCSRIYYFTLNVTSQDLKTGDFIGTGYFFPNPFYLWEVTGKVKGSRLTMTAAYTRPGVPDIYNFQGTIDNRGEISGTVTGVGATFDWTTALVVDLPTEKAHCKKDGWQTYQNPIFRNQGDCISFL